MLVVSAEPFGKQVTEILEEPFSMHVVFGEEGDIRKRGEVQTFARAVPLVEGLDLATMGSLRSRFSIPRIGSADERASHTDPGRSEPLSIFY